MYTYLTFEIIDEMLQAFTRGYKVGPPSDKLVYKPHKYRYVNHKP